VAFKINGIHHASIVVKDLGSALTFYCDVLGLTVNNARPDIGYPGAWLDVGGQQIHLLQLDSVDPRVGRPDHVGRDRHTAFYLDDVEALILRLDQINIAYTASRSGRKAVFCRDPDGNGLEFVQQARRKPDLLRYAAAEATFS